MNQLKEISNPNKEHIAENFGKSVQHYHENAHVQKQSAQRLLASLKPWTEIIPPGPILEIGCGTGFVTRGLYDLFPNRDIEITDLSPEMVEFCKNHVEIPEKFNGKVTFEKRDGEFLQGEKEHYGLIISGFVAQWFKDPAYSMGRMLEMLKPGGLLLASFPGKDTFKEWKHHCETLDLPFTGNELPDTEEMVIKLSVGPVQVDFYEDHVTDEFENATAFFRHLKKTGVSTNKNDRQLSSSELRQLIRHWDSIAPNGVKVSYHTVFIAAKRDD